MQDITAGVMRVKKRGDRGYEPAQFDKITARIDKLVREGGYSGTVNTALLAQRTIANVYDGVSTEELDHVAASISESRKLVHPDYSGVAGRIMISNLHKTTPGSFSKCMEELSARLGTMSPTHMEFIRGNASILDAMINHSADYKFSYTAYRALERQYLHSVEEPETDINGKVVYVDMDGEVSLDTSVQRRVKTRRRVYDRPQYMFMRVAIEIALAGEDGLIAKGGGMTSAHMQYATNMKAGLAMYLNTIDTIRTYYTELSEMRFIYATPTNFNACTKFAQLNSCFLLNTADSIEEIMRTITNAAFISKRAGGIGIAYHKIRCRGAKIKGTNGYSSGIVPQLKIINEDARCWNQGGDKRPGAFAIYLEPWHGDIGAFLRMKLTQGADTERARDLFYALWMSDLFMLRAREDLPLSLFSDDSAPGLSEVFDGMHVCEHCGHCENFDYKSLVARGVLTREDVGVGGDAVNDSQNTQATIIVRPECQHSYRARNVFSRLYTRYEREGRAIRKVPPSHITDAICEAQRDQGVPYICYKDHANRQTNQLNIGTLQSSNLCVAPETYVLTDKGQYPIRELVDRECNVWNGKEFSQVRVVKTGENQKLIRVHLSNGARLDCTPYHKFHLNTEHCSEGRYVVCDAGELEPGDVLILMTLPIITEGAAFDRAREIGGTASDRGEVPLNARREDKIAWLQGFFDSHTKVSGDCMLAVGGYDFLFHIQLMLQTIGIYSTVSVMTDYQTSLISIYATSECAPTRWHSNITVTSIEDIGRTDDTYCFTEPKVGRGVFNGILTGQCTEIFEWHSKDEYACCSLASINLKSYLVRTAGVGTGGHTSPQRVNTSAQRVNTSAQRVDTSAQRVDTYFDFERLHANVKLVARGLDRIITSNQYPVPECKKNANKYRPIGIGVQGLANVFMELRIPFLSPEAEKLDLEIFETIYHAALEASCELAAELGPYTQFEGSPISQGLLRMDLWLHNQLRMRTYGVENGMLDAMAQYGFAATGLYNDIEPAIAQLPTYRGAKILSGRYDWDAMRVRAALGTRNSLLIAPMPTVTTSILLGNYESFEPAPMNIYTKSTGAGKFTECNDYMVRHLNELGLWNDAMKNRIIANEGSLTGIESIPADVQKIYETVWEMKQTAIMRRAAMRHVFIDQGQSLNIHLRNNSNAFLRGVLTYGWELGNNTGSYYIRTPPAAEPLKNNIAEVREQQWTVVSADGPVCTPGCDSCGS